jgi:hypothetical protein
LPTQSPAEPGYPSVAILRKLSTAGSYDTVATCVSLTDYSMPTQLSDQFVRSNATDPLDCGGGSGYYRWSGVVVDRAGNPSTLIARNFVRDDAARPVIAGVLPVTPLVAGDTARVQILASDDVEVIGASLALTQSVDLTTGGTGLLYASAVGLGVKWDNVLTQVVTNGQAKIGYFLFRVDEACIAVTNPYPNCPAPNVPALAIAPLTNNNADYQSGALGLPTQVTADVFDVAKQFSGTPLTTPLTSLMFNPVTGATAVWDATKVLSWSASIVGSNVVAVHKGVTSIVVPYFSGASLWRKNTANQWVFCSNLPNNPGTNSATNNPYSHDSGGFRFWNYTVAVPTAGDCVGPAFGAGNNFRVMGTLSGQGLFTPTVP